MHCLRTVLIAALLIAGLAQLSGCIVQSEKPLYLPDDDTWISALPGSWQDGEGNRLHFHFPPGFPKGFYALKITGKDGNETNFRVRPTKIGEVFFLDFTMPPVAVGPAAAGKKQPDMHIICRLDLDIPNDSFSLAMLDLKWFTDYLTANTGALKHRMVQESGEDEEGRTAYPVLTASTTDLRAFIELHLEDDICVDPVVYTRVPGQ